MSLFVLDNFLKFIDLKSFHSVCKITKSEPFTASLIELEKDHNRREAMKRAAGMVFPKSTSDTIYNKIHESLQL